MIWRNRKPVDLNSVIGSHPHVLTAARDVSDAGVITGNLVKQGTDTNFAFVAIPKWGVRSRGGGSSAAPAAQASADGFVRPDPGVVAQM